MTRFLSARIVSVPVFSYGCRAVRLGLRVGPSGVQMDIEGDQTMCGEMVHGSKGLFGAEVEIGA